MTEINLGTAPAPVHEAAHILATSHNERVIGFKALTKNATEEPCDKGCMAPGSSPHYHSIVTSYLVVTEGAEGANGGIYEVDPEGYVWSAGVLHTFENGVRA